MNTADFTELERRILAMDTLAGALGVGSAELKAAGQDLYRAYAAKMFNVAPSKVTPEQRRYAKTSAYTKIYQLHPKDHSHASSQEGPSTGRRQESTPRFQDYPVRR